VDRLLRRRWEINSEGADIGRQSRSYFADALRTTCAAILSN